ncbi:hypothetical protein, partial [Desulfosarcina cetonica]|uniref:hypothetical protein n=1 Tax=Desulfosarcina cetonica TaxID=90730 RepID=UPI001C444DAA
RRPVGQGGTRFGLVHVMLHRLHGDTQRAHGHAAGDEASQSAPLPRTVLPISPPRSFSALNMAMLRMVKSSMKVLWVCKAYRYSSQILKAALWRVNVLKMTDS